jgi:hypothetical protein
MGLFARLKDLLTERYWFEGMSEEEQREVTAPDRYPAFKAQKEAEVSARYEELLAMYRAMSLAEGKVVAQAAIAFHDEDPFYAQMILGYLVNVVPSALTDVHHAILDSRTESPAAGFLFFGADASVRDRMLTLLDAELEDDRLRSELVCGLAWIGDEVVQQRFAEWRRRTQLWETEYWKTAAIMRESGWELAGDGKRRDLFFPESYTFISVDKTTPDQLLGPVAVITYQEERCRWCRRPVVTLFGIALTDPRMAFLGVAGERLRLGMCLNCSLQAQIYWKFDLKGHMSWRDANPKEPPDDLYMYGDEERQPLPEKLLVLDKPRKTLVETIGRYSNLEPRLSQLGGLPEWVQYTPYPVCPSRQETMRFIGQLAPIDLVWREGMFYAFVCFACGISTTKYEEA